MTEQEAQDYVRERLSDSTSERFARLEQFVALLEVEMRDQNLIAASTLPMVWNRHIADSVQLLDHLGSDVPNQSRWLDIGSGAGFPGLVIAIATDFHVTLVEPRAGRVAYLNRVIAALSLDNATVVGSTLEKMAEPGPFDVISARAVASLDRLLPLAHRFSTEKTRWLLPKGRSAEKELVSVQPTWQGVFHVKPSATDGESALIVAHAVAPRVKGRTKANDSDRNRQSKRWRR